MHFTTCKISTLLKFLLILITIKSAFIRPLMAAEQVLPSTPDLYLQTNGRMSERNNGDWWTNAAGGDTLHELYIQVPPTADPDFVLSIELYDPESYDNNGGLDEKDKRGGMQWDTTFFKLYPPNSSTPIADVFYPPDGSTTNLWIPLASFPISTYGTGTYKIFSRTEIDDENFFRIRVLDDDPDGIPNTGDEIKLRVYKSTIQFIATDSTTLWFYVDPGTVVLNLYNFDMDGPLNTPRFVITDPLDNSTNGTISGNNVWESGSTTVPTGTGDQFINPEPGWWRVDMILNTDNQIIFYGPLWSDNAPSDAVIIGDFVWEDLNGNGIQDVSEPGMENVRVRLRDVTDTVVDSTLSDATGSYLFGNVTAGDYRVEFVPPPLYEMTLQDQGADDSMDSDADPATNSTAMFTVIGGEQQLNVDAGLLQRETQIGDIVWLDADMDGIQDSLEVGLAGVIVNLLDSGDNVVNTQSTGSSGEFLFIDPAPADYRLEFVLPPNYFFTARDRGGDDTIDSDPDPLTGRTDLFTVNQGDQLLSWDAGVNEKNVSDLAIAKVADQDYVQPGDTIVYTITVTNLGPDSTDDATIVDNLPTALIFVDAVPPQTSGPNPLIWQQTVLDSGDTQIFTIRTRATDAELGGLDNNAFVSTQNLDPDLNNNSAAAQIHILIPVELSSFTANVINNSVVLEWITQSESENMGFHLFRASDIEGQYTRLTTTLIPGAGNSQAEKRYRYVDGISLTEGQTVYYKLADLAYDGSLTMHEPVAVSAAQPLEYQLEQNYPNPFNIQTNIQFQLKKGGDVELVIYNMQGQVVRRLLKKNMNAGFFEVSWDGRNDQGEIVPSGNYIYSIRVNEFNHTQKMLLIK